MTAPDRPDAPRIDEPLAHGGMSDAALGTLVLMGGAVEAHNEAFQSFLRLVDARDGAPIVGLTTASADPGEAARAWLGDFRRAGATNVRIPLFQHACDERDREIADMIKDSRAVFFGGGDQVKLVAALGGSHTLGEIKALFRRGGVVCGSSAGAAALTELTMAGGEIDEEGSLVEQYIGPGLGLLGFKTIVDTHFQQRRRLQRLFVVVGQNTELLGLGIDEDTALIARGHVGEVVGAGGVTFVDGHHTVRFDNADEIEKGRQLTLSHLRVGIVGTNYHLNLRERELEELLERDSVPGSASPFLSLP
ncbi:MAG TPA: cyanophycinase [Gemmatimonadaceae bacterium]|jgi:cyanophycinase